MTLSLSPPTLTLPPFIPLCKVTGLEQLRAKLGCIIPLFGNNNH
jgi:hypothetical protein